MVGSAESLRQTQLHSCTIELHAVQLNMPVDEQHETVLEQHFRRSSLWGAHHDFHRRWS